MKKIDFFNSAKLLTMTIGLILGAFVMLSMAFPEDGSGISDNSSEYAEGYPNDSTNNSGPKPHKSHYYQQASCGGTDTKHGVTDYAKAVAITTGGGTVTLSDGGGGGVVTNNGGTSGSENGNSITFEWNCGSTADQSSATATEAMHKHSVIFAATPDDNHSFVGWSKTSSEDDIVSKESPYMEEMFINDWNKNNGSYENASKALTLTYYAIFKEKVRATITMAATEGGSYTYTCTDGNGVVSTQQQSITTQNAITFTATPSSGYKFFGWYTMNGDNEEFFSYSSTLEKAFFANTTLYAKFIPADWALFSFKDGDGTLFYDLNKVITIATKGSIIVLATDGTLPAGNYTIPQGVTLLIPFDDEYSCYTTEPMILHGWRTEDDKGQRSSVTDPSTDQSFVYSTLTLASGAQLNIEGIVSLSAKRWCVINSGVSGSGSSATYSNANPSGSNRIYQGFGLINMENNSSIQVKSGGKLYCWGRIRGEGAIIAKSGAEVRESYVYTDWRNNDYFANYAKKTRCFPQNQYYIQDIQVPITYESGATCYLVAALFYSKGTSAPKGTMNFVGTSNSFIELPTGATMTKKYDATTDRLIIDLENGASFNNFKLKITSPSFEAATNSHIFTITNNWTVNINSGTTNMTYDLAWAPGSVLNIKQGAAVTMLNGMSMYVYDHDDWGDFAAGRRIQPLKTPSQEAKYGVTVKARTYDADCPDAEFIVDGTLTVTGGQNIVMNSTATNCSFDNSNKGVFQSGLYTTEAGANIHGIGTIQYLKGCGDQTKTQQLNLTTDWNTNVAASNIKYSSFPIDVYGTGMARPTIIPAKLKNADDSYTATAGASGMSTFKYFSEDGEWKQAWKVTFMNEGEEFSSAYYAQGDEIIPPTEELPTKAGYELTGWSNISEPMGTTDIVSEAQWEQIKIEVSTIEVTPTKVITNDTTETSITENNTYTITEMTEATEVTIGEGATLNVADDVSLTVTGTLVINASEDKSGDLPTAENIEVADNAEVYFDYSFNTPAMRWNAIAFPWQVDATSGVKVSENLLVLGTDFDIIYYDGETRATQGPVNDCWKYVEDDISADVVTNPAILVPGRLYMILFAQAQEVVRFAKATGASLVNTDPVNVKQYSGNGINANWNGIANPALYHAYLDAGVAEGQTYNNANDSYSTITLASASFPIGKPVFVQADQAQSVVVSKQQPSQAPAYWAANESTPLRAEVELMNANNVVTDKVILRTDEDALDEYTIGSDLAKAGVSSKVAQMWVNRYGAKLCKNTIAPVNDVADYPLTIFVPISGEYTLVPNAITNSDYALYLTYEGVAFAELTENGYTLGLLKGNNSEYGVRLIRKQPGVATSLDEALILKNAQKVIYQGNLYIIRNKRIYNAAGQLIK